MNLLLIVLQFYFLPSNTKEVVKQFHELKTRESEDLFIKTYKLSKDPSVLAYSYAVDMKQAEYSYNPYTKLKTFNQGKKKLDELILTNKDNIHLRYIRLVIQEKTPKILNYNQFIEVDKSFLRAKLNTIDESDYLDIYIYNNTSL